MPRHLLDLFNHDCNLHQDAMRTCLFTNMYLRGNDPSGNPRIDRAIKFLDYYYARNIGFDQIYVTDNGGQSKEIAWLIHYFPHIKLIRHPYMERGRGHDYLPCWRTTHDYQIAIHDGFEKLILLDDDAFILSTRLLKHVNELKSGWEAMYCPKWDLPETGLSILCKDAFPAYFEFLKIPYANRNHQDNLIENILPYTKVNKDFNCDRWGEDRAPQARGMDAYFQCPVDIPMKFEP